MILYIIKKSNFLKMSKKIEDKYKVLDQISHVILRPTTYVGSNKPHTASKSIINENSILQKELTYIPSFLKIFDEVATNSIDEFQRTKELTTIKIDINIKEGWVSVFDDGGIPVVIHQDHGKYVPEVIFGNLMSGSNYDDTDERTGAGVNGLGSKLTNIFSKKFEVSTCDGKNLFTQIFTNNMRDRTEPKVKKSKSNHTCIKYYPDFAQFSLDGIDETHFKLIEKRVYDLAGCNPDIKFYFNGAEIKFKSFEDYVKLYQNDYFFETNSDKSWSIAVAPSSDGFQQVSFVNSTETYDGGTHVEYILSQILTNLREFFQKKHKVDIKPSELKSHISIYINSTIINPSFSSQTKEKLITEVKDFGYTYQISEKLTKWILKSEIVQSVLDWIQRKKDADENKLTRELNKNLSKLKVEKLIDAKGKDRKSCSLGLYEGDSASGSFRKYRDTQTQGAFSLRGKFTNAAEITTQKLIQNNEVVNLMAALGLKLGQKLEVDKLRYGKILLYVDADSDGNSIAALLINFFFKFWPELFENEMIYKVETPIVVTKNNKTKKKIYFYTQNEYNKWLENINTKDWEIEYKKGLAALLDDEYQDIIQNPILTKIKTDELSKNYLNIWFGKETDLRKIEIMK
jgi:DNA topoisomerase-2